MHAERHIRLADRGMHGLGERLQIVAESRRGAVVQPVQLLMRQRQQRQPLGHLRQLVESAGVAELTPECGKGDACLQAVLYPVIDLPQQGLALVGVRLVADLVSGDVDAATEEPGEVAVPVEGHSVAEEPAIVAVPAPQVEVGRKGQARRLRGMQRVEDALIVLALQALGPPQPRFLLQRSPGKFAPDGVNIIEALVQAGSARSLPVHYPPTAESGARLLQDHALRRVLPPRSSGPP